jgi:predicted ATP-dependent endonuclease of OLD family
MPTIRNISIEHYKGFYQKRDILPAQPSGANGSGLTILVGPNNSGKSSVLNAIRLVLSPRQVDLEHRHSNELLKISITNDAGKEKSVSNPDLGAKLVVDGEEGSWPSANDVRFVPSRRSWSPYTGNQTMETLSYWGNALNRNPGEEDNYLVSRVAALTTAERQQFDVLIKELLPQLNTWKIELSRGQTFIQYETKSGAKHAADLFGDGMSSIFRIALTLTDSGRGHVVIIDEPELSLHPQAQKALATVLSRHARDNQVIMTTHSPYFVNWSDIANGAQVYRLTQEDEGISVGVLQQQTLRNLRGLVDDWQKPNLLDVVSREIFFADEVVFFEGQEDVGLLKKFAVDRLLPSLPAFGYGAGGAGNIAYFLQMAKDLRIPAAAVFDGDHVDLKNKVAADFSGYLIELLPTPDMRDKLKRDNQGKETKEIDKEGMFDRHGLVKPKYEDYLRNLFARLLKSLTRTIVD